MFRLRSSRAILILSLFVFVPTFTIGESRALSRVLLRGSTGKLSSQIVWSGEHVGGREGTVGFCLKGVEDSLEAIGIHLPRLAYAREMGPVFRSDKKQFKEISRYSRLRPGDIIVHGGAPANPDGHIAIVLPQGLESSDHIQALISPLNPSFGRSRVFQPVG